MHQNFYEKKKYYTAMNELVFKNALCTESNKFLLKWLLEKILDKKIEDLVIKNNERPVSIYNKKIRTLDVLVQTLGNIINVELNSSYYSLLPIRNAGYLMSNYIEDLNRGESYDKMNNHVQINFTIGLPDNRPIEEKYILTGVKSGHAYIESFMIIEYNISKLLKYYHSSNKKEREQALKYKHIIMLALGGDELQKICKGDVNMEQFKKNVDKLNDNEEMRFLFSAEEDAIRTHNTLMNEAQQAGFEQGKMEKAIETAKNLLKSGIDKKIIINATGLSKEQIMTLNEKK